MGFGFSSFNAQFSAFGILFTVVFVLVIGIFVVAAVRGILTWSKNNQTPRLTVSAEVVTKRINVSHHSHANAGDMSGAHGFHTNSSTRYYVTFQVESGDRIEFTVNGQEYGMLVEGDFGSLTFQGTRYLSFTRQ